ncbi:MFS transporter [Roseibium sp.]|uniref:MFS transporter n=1 Tax=Roseibium sp. TaxID=1936156 RepID=UPI003BAF63D6
MNPYDQSLFRMTVAMAASGLGITLMKIALPALTASHGGSPARVGLVAGTIAAAWPLFGLTAGWVLDRFGRIAGFWSGLFAAGFAAAALLSLAGQDASPVLLLCSLGLLVGIGEVLTETAGQTILPDLVDRDRFHDGNSLLQGVKTVFATLLAPLLIALLLGVSPFSVFLVAFVAVAVSFLTLPKPQRMTRSAQKGFAGFLEGAHLLWASPDQRRLTLLLALMSVSWGAWMTLIVPYALSESFLNIGTAGIGYVMTAMGCGSLLGAACYRWLRSRLGDGRTRLLDPVATLIFVLVPAAGLGLWPVLATAFFAGIGGVTWAISIATYQQSTIPAGSLGRVVAAYRWIGWSGFFIGASLSGFIANVIGLQLAFLVFAAPAMAALLVCVFSKRGSRQVAEANQVRF